MDLSQLLKENKAKTKQVESVDLPVAQVTVFVRALNGRERELYEQHAYELMQEGIQPSITTLAALHCSCNKDGVLSFLGKNGQIDKNKYYELSEMNGADLIAVFNKADELNALSNQKVEQSKKPSKAGSKDSAIGSQKTSAKRGANSRKR